MKHSKSKKGFTLVELVIVIAVIAILVAVLLPTFSNVLDKTRQSTDTQTARNMEPELRNYALSYSKYLSASDMRYTVSHEELFPTNKEGDSYWFEISTGRVKLCKGSELAQSVSADAESHILEEIIPGYIILDNGGTKLGERMRELRNLEDAGNFENILTKLSDATIDYGLTEEQIDGAVGHLRLFNPSRTLYINNFGYVTNIQPNNNYMIVENVVMCDGIMELPEFTLPGISIDEHTVVCFPNGIMIPKSMQVIDQNSVLNYTGRYTDSSGATMETDFSFINKSVKTQGDPNNLNNNLFSQYMMERYPAILDLEVNARAFAVGKCTFTVAINTAIKRPLEDYIVNGEKVVELTDEQANEIGNMYSELSIVINVPKMYDYVYDEEGKITYDENGEPVLDTSVLLNEGIISEKFKYTKQADGSIRVDARIYDQYGVLCNGTTVYKPDVSISGFRFNNAAIFYTTPDVKVGENELVRYKLYIKNSQGNYALVDTIENAYTDTAAAEYLLDQSSDLDGYMLFLSTNDGYRVCDNDGYYAEYNSTSKSYTWYDVDGNYTTYNKSSDTYQWYNAETGSAMAGKNVVTPTKENIKNYYVFKEISWSEEEDPGEGAEGSVNKKTTYYSQSSKITKEKDDENNDVLNEYFYACTTVVTQTITEEGKYINNNVVENHEGFARYIYPYIVDSSYITVKTSENGQKYNTIDGRIELYYVDKDGKEQLLAKRSETFGSPESPVKPYYYTETVYKTDSIRYKYNYTFKNPLYYEQGSTSTELFTFTDKDIIYYTENGENDYTFKVNKNPVEGKIGQGVDIWFMDQKGKDKSLVGNYDANYNVKYSFNLDKTRVTVEIIGLDSVYSVFGSEEYNSYAYKQRYTYRYTLDREELQSVAEFDLKKFNGKQVTELSNNVYETYVYVGEQFNPLTTIFNIYNQGENQQCNANVFNYTYGASDNPEYDSVYTFKIDVGDIKVYCKQKNIETHFSFVYPDIAGSEMTATMGGEDYVYNYSNISSASLQCGYGEEITLTAKDFGEDSEFTFIAWYETTPEYGKKLISTDMVTQYYVPASNVVISCEYATNCLKNDVLLFTDGKITYCNDKTITRLYVPSYMEGRQITAIETNAFVGVTNLEYIYLPDTMVTIDANAFIGSKINVAGSTTYFGTYLYKYVDEKVGENYVTEYSVKEGTKIIGDYAFSGNSNLKVVRIPDSVVQINTYAFQRMANLEYVYVTSESMLNKIDSYAFSRSTKFKGIIVEGSDNVIPPKLVTLGNCTFEFCSSLESFDFSHIKTMGTNCFQYCISLTSVDLTSDTLVTLPNYAFAYCAKLENVNIGANITTINNNVFAYCTSLVELTVPETVTKLGTNLMQGCNVLEKIILPTYVGTTVPAGMVNGCTNLTAIYIGSEDNLLDFTKVTSIGASAFYNCYNYPFGDFILGSQGETMSIGASAFYGCNNMTTFTFKGKWSATNLPDAVFQACTNLRTADLGGATNLGANFFNGCSTLTTVRGFTLDVINTGIFQSCTNLKSIPVKDFSGYSQIGALAFFNCQNLELGDIVLGSYKANGTYTFDKVLVLDRAFYQCYKLTSFTAIAKVVEFRFTNTTDASYFQFNRCTGLTKFVVNSDEVWFASISDTDPDSTTSYRFLPNCTALTDMELNCYKVVFTRFYSNAYTNSTNQDLPRYICENCTNLKNAVIPYTTKFLITAFRGCSSLESITKYYKAGFTGTYVPTVSTDSFTTAGKFTGAKINSDGLLYVDVSSGKQENIVGYIGTATDVTIPSTITSDYTVKTIKNGTFKNSKIIKNLTIPGSVTTIEDGAFANSVFEKITFQHTAVPTIADNAFSGINKSVVIVFTNIEGDDWKNIKAFNDLYVTGGGDNPGDDVVIFKYSQDGTTLIECTQSDIVNVTLPDTVTHIAANVFKGNTSLASVEMPGVTEIGISAFEGCTSLTDVYMPACQIIRDKAFYNCLALNIQLPEELTYIGESAFEGTALVSVTLPTTVTTISQKALYNAKLKEVTVLWTNPTVVPGTNAFNASVTGFKIIVPDTSAKANYTSRWSAYKNYLYAPSEAEYTVSNGVLTAFNKNKVVQELDLTGENITQIKNVLAGYTTLVTLRLPSTVTTIDEGAFKGCTGLTSIIFSGETEIKTINKDTFNGCSKLKDISNLKWGKIESIGKNAFTGTAINITGFEIYATLAEGVFQNCKSMTNITISNMAGVNRTEIPANTFSGCIALKTVTLPAGITIIGNGAFYNCNKLERVNNLNISTLASIGNNAFNACKVLNLGDITIKNSAISGATNAFTSAVKITSVTFEKDSDTQVTIPGSMFSSCSALTTVNLNDKITAIGASAFNGCSKLVMVNTSDRITEENAEEKLITLGYVNNIGASAFKGCVLVEKIIVSTDNVVIGANAFDSMKKLSVAEFGKVSSFGNNAFNNCVLLTNYSAISVGTYGAGVFSGCSALTVIDLGSISVIPANIFKGANYITKVTAENVTTISDSAFENCINLTEFTITDSSERKLTTIGASVFKNCTSLVTLDISFEDVTKIGNYAFNNCISLANQTGTLVIGKEGSTLTMGTYVFANAFATVIDEADYTVEDEEGNLIVLDDMPKVITHVAFMGNLASGKIPDYTFQNDKGITLIDFNGGLTQVGASAFDRCTSLEKITLSGNDLDLSTLTAIGNSAFYYCTLLDFTDTATINITSVGTNAFAYTTRLKNVVFTNSGIKTMPSGIFSYCTNLKTVTLKEGTVLTTIGGSAFANCYSLTDIYNLTLTGLNAANTLGNSAFANCRNLNWEDNVVIGIADKPFSFHTSGSQFANNYKLKNVEILSSNTTTLPGSAFSGCYNLESVKVPSTVVVFNSSVFANCINLTNLYYNDGSVYDYSKITTLNSSVFSGCNSIEYDNGKLVLGDKLNTIASYTYIFANNLKLKEVVFMPNTAIVTINNYTFQYCSNLKTVTLNDTITTINTGVFQMCERLEDIKLITKGEEENVVTDNYGLNKLVTINSSAFNGCEALKIDLKLEKVTTLAASAFYKCRSITSVDFTGNTTLTAINGSVFAYCDKLKDVTLVSIITKIDTSAFAYCFSIEQIDISYVTTLNTSAFSNCQSLTKVTLGNGLKTIGNTAFANCVTLTNVVLPSDSKLTTIGTSSFLNCISLREISLPATLTTINATAFQRCTILKYIYLKNTAVSINASAFTKTTGYYLVYEDADKVDVAKVKMATFAPRIITLGVSDANAKEYGFDIVSGNLISYNGTYKDIVITADTIKVRNNPGEAYITINLTSKLNNIFNFAFVNLDGMTIDIDSSVSKATNWAYRVNFAG